MKITDTRPTGGVRPLRRYETQSEGAGPSGPRDIADSASVMGIPAQEMTPKVRAAIMTLMQEVERARHELENVQRRVQELEKLADQDPLVHMANRRAFVRELSRMISFADRYDVPTSIVYFDVNDLKTLNDRHGHNAGDAAILHVAQLIQRHIRESDIAGRLGGDEFAVILPNTTEQTAHDKAASLAQLIRDTPMTWGEGAIPLSVAHGSYSFQAGEDADQALAEADRKMYAHKRSLKSTIT